MRPRLDELFQSIRWSFDNFVLPTVTDVTQLRSAKSISVLMEQAEQRLSHEGQAAFEEIAELRSCLRDHREQAAVPLKDAIDAELAVAFPPADRYLDHLMLAERVAAVRGLLLRLRENGQLDSEVFRTYLQRQLERDQRYLPKPSNWVPF